MKRIVLTLAGCVAMLLAPSASVDAQTTEFNATGLLFLDVPNVSAVDIANGLVPTFAFAGGNENVANGSLPQLTDG